MRRVLVDVFSNDGGIGGWALYTETIRAGPHLALGSLVVRGWEGLVGPNGSTGFVSSGEEIRRLGLVVFSGGAQRLWSS